MKYKDPITGEIKDIYVKALDNLPVGSIVDYDGDVVPDGYEEVSEWKLAGTTLGAVPINIPADAKELRFISYFDSDGNRTMAQTTIFVDDIKPSGTTFIHDGYYDQTSNYAMFAWYGNKSAFGLARVSMTGANKTTETTTKMYYK